MAEVVKTFLQMRAYVRELYLDIDPVDQFATDGQVNNRINDYYHSYMYGLDRALIAHDALSFTAGSKIKVLDPSNESAFTAHNNVVRIARVTRAGIPLIRAEADDIIRRQFAIGTSAAPTEYAVDQVNPGQGNAPQPMKFNVYVYPIPDVTYSVVVYTQDVVDDLIADPDQPRLTAAECNWVCRLAAADLGMAAGVDPPMIQQILSLIPQNIQDRMRINQNFMLPRPERAGKEQS